MSEQQPPAGTPEYLDSGSGVPWAPAPEQIEAPAGRRSRRTVWLVGGGAVALLAVGAGAWAAVSFFSQGSQPAEALPSTTVAYASIDLDPSGGQKIDAFRTLNKFPTFKDEVGVNSVDELRHKLGEQLISDSGCPGLDYGRDVDSWLGDRMAGAVVPLGDGPHLVVVVQVTDEDQARSGIAKINDCTDTGDDGVVVKDGWAVLADVPEGRRRGRGGDRRRHPGRRRDVPEVDRSGGRRRVWSTPTRHPTPAASSPRSSANSSAAASARWKPPRPPGRVEPSAFRATAADDGNDSFSQALSGFKGGAATLRFTGDGVELAMAGDGSSRQLSELTGTTGGELVRRLPDDTAAAVGVSLPKGWLTRQVDALSLVFGGGTVRTTSSIRQISRETGLDAPGDIETLLGSGVALSVGHDIDLKALPVHRRRRGCPGRRHRQGRPGRRSARSWTSSGPGPATSPSSGPTRPATWP